MRVKFSWWIPEYFTGPGACQLDTAACFTCGNNDCEPGETLEEAVRREVHEEAGISVGRVRYLASQPWPFPSSLMIGCLAEAESETITVDRVELEVAQWFPREVVRASLRGESSELVVPPPYTLAA